jgi:hypothetical protein
MADIINEKIVAITPTGHVKIGGGSPVVVPEGLMEEVIASARIIGKTECMGHDEEAERLPEGGLPVKFLAGARSGLDWLNEINPTSVLRDGEFRERRSETGGEQADLDGRRARIGWKEECIRGQCDFGGNGEPGRREGRGDRQWDGIGKEIRRNTERSQVQVGDKIELPRLCGKKIGRRRGRLMLVLGESWQEGEREAH